MLGTAGVRYGKETKLKMMCSILEAAAEMFDQIRIEHE